MCPSEITLTPAVGIKASTATITCTVRANQNPEVIRWYKAKSYITVQPSFEYDVRYQYYAVKHLVGCLKTRPPLGDDIKILPQLQTCQL